jgi:hypothetical protein
MRKSSLNALLYFLLSLSLACSNSQEINQQKDQQFSEEALETAAVFSAAIKDAALDKYEHGLDAPLYISTNAISDATVNWADGYPNTSFDKRFEGLKKRYSSVGEVVLRSYLQKLKENFKFSKDLKLTLRTQYEFVDGDMIKREMSKDWPDLPNIPGPVLQLSRVGFNETYDQAFLEMEYVACPLCGFGASYYLEKKDGMWKIKEHFGGWIS